MHNFDFRSQPPIASGQLDFSFPNFDISVINNHKIYFIQDKTQPLISVKFLFKLGSYHEQVHGLAHFTAQMLTLGNSIFNAEEIAEKIDYFGAQLSSASYWDELVTSITCLDEYTDELLTLLFDCILTPTFEESEIERLKKRQIAYIQQQNADPSYIAQVAFNEIFYKNTNYGHARIGYENSINQITQNDIRNFYNKLINSDFAVIVSGNFDENNISKIMNEKLPSHIKTTEKDDIYENIDIDHQILFVDKEDATQATFRLGKPSIKRTDSDFPAFITANTIFGGFFLSRLNENLREKKGLTYGINSYNDARRYFSTFMIGTNINEENSKIAIDEIFKELDDFNSKQVTSEELNRAIQYMLGSFARGMENHRQLSSLIQTIESYNLPMTYYQDIYSKISKLTVDDVFETQRKYFNKNNMLVLISGNKSRLEKIFN